MTELVERQNGRKQNITLWAIQIVLALTYVSFGWSMLSDAAEAVAVFDRIGWGDWFRYTMGALYLVSAIGLLIPRICVLAGIVLGCLITIGIVSHAAIAEPKGAFFVIPLVLVILVVRGRRSRTPQISAKSA